MRLLPLLLFILGCPKSNLPSVEEKERQEALKEMLLEEEDFDDWAYIRSGLEGYCGLFWGCQ